MIGFPGPDDVVLAIEQRPIFPNPPLDTSPFEIKGYPRRLSACLPVEVKKLRLGRVEDECVLDRRGKMALLSLVRHGPELAALLFESHERGEGQRRQAHNPDARGPAQKVIFEPDGDAQRDEE